MIRLPVVRRALVLGVMTVLSSSFVSGNDATSELESFRRLHTLIKPKAAEENWVQIPWMTSLWEARQRAAAEGKPILLWEMDGHPLGCT